MPFQPVYGRRTRGRTGAGVGALLTCVALWGCVEPSSYAVRWNVQPRDLGDEALAAPQTAAPQDDEMTNPVVCSRVGVSQVQVAVYDELGAEADTFDQPCFPERFRRPGSAVEGGTLPPGEYTAVIFGTRANARPWGECPDLDQPGSQTACAGLDDLRAVEGDLCDDGRCTVGLGTCACQTFRVSEDVTTRLGDVSLEAPPDCEDGIDGDDDGLVDQLDPGCQANGFESASVLPVQLQLQLSLLSGNPSARCSGVGISDYQVQLDGEDLATLPCATGPLQLRATLDPGPQQLSLTGVDANGAPVTRAKPLFFDVLDSGTATPREFAIDFADTDFLQPLEGEARWTVNLLLPESEQETEGLTSIQCTSEQSGVTQYAFTLLDASGEPLADPVSSEAGPLDGSLVPCVGAAVRSELLTWGLYQLQVEAFTDAGELCASNVGSAVPLAPDTQVPVDVPPVEGAPASCLR